MHAPLQGIDLATLQTLLHTGAHMSRYLLCSA
jgi:hypothetical protein